MEINRMTVMQTLMKNVSLWSLISTARAAKINTEAMKIVDKM